MVLPGDRLLLTTDYDVPAVLLQVKRDGDRWTPEEVWTANHLATNFSTAVVRDHYAYGLNDGALTCIDLDKDGEEVWQARGISDRFGYGQVLLVEDLLIVQAERGDVALVKADPSGYHKLGVLHAFTSKTWNNPALAGNRLFLATTGSGVLRAGHGGEALNPDQPRRQLRRRYFMRTARQAPSPAAP